VIAELKRYPAMKNSDVPWLGELTQEAVVKNFFTTAADGKNYSAKWHFYTPALVRTLEDICADILALEKKTKGLLGEIIGGGK
jgi:hypothetical protein